MAGQDKGAASVRPLYYFKADWAAEQYQLDPYVAIIRPSEDDMSLMAEIIEDEAQACCPDFREAVNWALRIQLPPSIQERPWGDVGVSFREAVEDDVVAHFLTALRITKSTTAVAPVRFASHDTVEDAGTTLSGVDDYFQGLGHSLYEPPPAYWPQVFGEADLQTLSEVWEKLVDLHNLRGWVSLVFSERFFREVDSEATGEARREHRVFQEKMESAMRKVEEEHGAAAQKIIDILQSWISDDSADPDVYRDHFRTVFRSKRNMIRNGTRLGRAVSLFDEGLRLPPLHSFLSMFLVLETLYSTDRAELTHKLATRLAKLIGKNEPLQKRREQYSDAKKAYGERSAVVHGEKPFESVADKWRQKAMYLARASIQRILRDDELFSTFSSAETGKNKGESVKTFFRDLELQG